MPARRVSRPSQAGGSASPKGGLHELLPTPSVEVPQAPFVAPRNVMYDEILAADWGDPEGNQRCWRPLHPETQPGNNASLEDSQSSALARVSSDRGESRHLLAVSHSGALRRASRVIRPPPDRGVANLRDSTPGDASQQRPRRRAGPSKSGARNLRSLAERCLRTGRCWSHPAAWVCGTNPITAWVLPSQP